MKVNVIDKTRITVEVETPTEAHDAIKCLARIKPHEPEYIPRITMADRIYEVPAGRSALEGNGGWARATVETDFIKPYWDHMKKLTGADPFEVDLSEAVRGIYHTHIAESLIATANGTAVFTCVTRVYAYMDESLIDGVNEPQAHRKPGRSFDEALNLRAMEYVQDDLGESIVESEFIPFGDRGLYKRNPNYGRGRIKYRSALKNQHVFALMFRAWRDRYATEGQKAMLARIATTGGKFGDVPAVYEDRMHIDNYNSSITWAEFRALV